MKHAKQEKRRTSIPLLAGIVIAATVIAGILFLSRWLGRDSGLSYEDNVVIGSVGSAAERAEELQQIMDKGMITMSINASPSMSLSDKGAGVDWQIENPAEQSTKLIRVEVYRDDTEEKIYETGAIRPGTYVTGTLPDVDLAEGEYPCTAYFYSYDIETEEFLGQAGAQVLLTVLP